MDTSCIYPDISMTYDGYSLDISWIYLDVSWTYLAISMTYNGYIHQREFRWNFGVQICLFYSNHIGVDHLAPQKSNPGFWTYPGYIFFVEGYIRIHPWIYPDISRIYPAGVKDISRIYPDISIHVDFAPQKLKTNGHR